MADVTFMNIKSASNEVEVQCFDKCIHVFYRDSISKGWSFKTLCVLLEKKAIYLEWL